MTLRFEPLSKAHDRTSFSSGSLELDRWFRTQAGQDARRGVARVFVALDQVGIAGFYTLSMFSVASDSLPGDVVRALPRYPDVPAALIGRLAHAERVRGQGLGELLVIDALKRILVAAKDVAAFAIIVDAKDTPAEKFYRRFGFESFPSRSTRMFLPAATAAKLLVT
jgi:GNAT superfamily N-acetyltransferase